jgi:chemotaxis protein MotB
MKPTYLQPPTQHRDRWMVSYVDVLTILLIFFVLATAHTLEVARAQAKAAIEKPAPRPAGERARTELLRVQQRLQEHGLESRLEPRGLVISLPQIVLFSSGEDTVNPDAMPALEHLAGAVRDIPNELRLIGHADTVPIHNARFQNNWDLSMARSRNILTVLSGRFGIPQSRLSIASYGPYRPAAPNDTQSGRASNRRVEIIILDEPEETQIHSVP